MSIVESVFRRKREVYLLVEIHDKTSLCQGPRGGHGRRQKSREPHLEFEFEPEEGREVVVVADAY